jgi:hypothetical protein
MCPSRSFKIHHHSQSSHRPTLYNLDTEYSSNNQKNSNKYADGNTRKSVSHRAVAYAEVEVGPLLYLCDGQVYSTFISVAGRHFKYSFEAVDRLAASSQPSGYTKLGLPPPLPQLCVGQNPDCSRRELANQERLECEYLTAEELFSPYLRREKSR